MVNCHTIISRWKLNHLLPISIKGEAWTLDHHWFHQMQSGINLLSFQFNQKARLADKTYLLVKRRAWKFLTHKAPPHNLQQTTVSNFAAFSKITNKAWYFMRIVCCFFLKIMKDVAKFVVCCSCDWGFKGECFSIWPIPPTSHALVCPAQVKFCLFVCADDLWPSQQFFQSC